MEFLNLDVLQVAICYSASKSGLPITPNLIEKLARTVVRLPDDDDIVVIGDRPASVVLEVGDLWQNVLQKLEPIAKPPPLGSSGRFPPHAGG